MTHEEAARLHEAAAKAQTPEATDRARQATLNIVDVKSVIGECADAAFDHSRHGRWTEASLAHESAAVAHRQTSVAGLSPIPIAMRQDYMTGDPEEDEWVDLSAYDTWRIGDVQVWAVEIDDYDMDPFLLWQHGDKWYTTQGEVVIRTKG